MTWLQPLMAKCSGKLSARVQDGMRPDQVSFCSHKQDKAGQEILSLAGGSAGLSLHMHRYHYPDQRRRMDLEGQYKEGVPGTTSVVCKASPTDQPVLPPSPPPPNHTRPSPLQGLHLGLLPCSPAAESQCGRCNVELLGVTALQPCDTGPLFSLLVGAYMYKKFWRAVHCSRSERLQVLACMYHQRSSTGIFASSLRAPPTGASFSLPSPLQ